MNAIAAKIEARRNATLQIRPKRTQSRAPTRQKSRASRPSAAPARQNGNWLRTTGSPAGPSGTRGECLRHCTLQVNRSVSTRETSKRSWSTCAGYRSPQHSFHGGGVRGAQFSPDGAASSPGVTTRPRGCGTRRTGRQLATLAAHEGAVVERASSARTGRRIVTASEDKTARVWDAATGKASPRSRHEDSVLARSSARTGAASSPRRCDKTARVWDAAHGQELLGSLCGHEGRGAARSSARTGARIVTASWRQDRAGVGRGDGQSCSARPCGHEAAGAARSSARTDAASSPRRQDKTARVWDAAAGKQLATARGIEGACWRRAFSPDGTPHRHRVGGQDRAGVGRGDGQGAGPPLAA